MSINPELYRPQIEALLREIRLGKCELVITDSVQDWAGGVGVQEDNPFRAGMAVVRSDGVQLIVVLKQITADIQTGVINAIEMRGFWEEVKRLEEPSAFLEHLVLHEAAHLLLDSPSESDCDTWAFARLRGGFPSARD